MCHGKGIDVSASQKEVRTDHAPIKSKDEEHGVREVNDAEKNSGDERRRRSIVRQELYPVHEIAVEEDLLKKCGNEIRDEPERHADREALVPEGSGVAVSAHDQNDDDPGAKEEPKASKPFEFEMSETQGLEGLFRITQLASITPRGRSTKKESASPTNQS